MTRALRPSEGEQSDQGWRGQERRQFAAWLRTGRLTERALGDGERCAEFRFNPEFKFIPGFKFNPWHDPEDGRFTWANSGRFFGGGGTPKPAAPCPPRGAPDGGGYDGPEIVVTAPRRTGERTRLWPVAGNGAPAVRGTRVSNGHTYADGRFSREGRYRIDRRTGRARAHMGIDLPGNPGDPVVAAADGVVVTVNRSVSYGNTVIIRHADGTATGYAHLATTQVTKGQHVVAGEPIATMGNTGNAHNMGTHLHFEVSPPGSLPLAVGAQRIDPTQWIRHGS